LVVSNFLPRSHRDGVKNISIMALGLRGRLTSPARVLPTVVPLHPVLKAQFLVLPARMARRRARLDPLVLAARGALNVRVVFPVLAARPVPVDREAVPVVRPVRVDLVAALVVLADHPVPA
jgi:hypothetical protein